jgi:hypothetical protein
MDQTLPGDPWELLRDAPLAAAAAVALADPGGARRETDALFRAWREGADLFPNSAVVQRIVQTFDPEQPADEADTPLPPTPEAVLDEALDLCRRAVALLAQTVPPPEADAYKDFVLHIARAVAEADQSGAVLGLGGVAVTLEERGALRAIRVALDYTPPELRL